MLEDTKAELSEKLQKVEKQLESALEEGTLLKTKVSEAEAGLGEYQKKLTQSEGKFVFFWQTYFRFPLLGDSHAFCRSPMS